MLARKNRLDKNTVNEVFEKGSFVNSPNLTFKFISKKGFPARVSFVTPKTASKIAPARNTLRRRGYAVLSRHLNTLPAGITGVFVFGKKSSQYFSGRKNKKHNPIQNLENEIKSILNKIN